jgi:hypothetical protein
MIQGLQEITVGKLEMLWNKANSDRDLIEALETLHTRLKNLESQAVPAMKVWVACGNYYGGFTCSLTKGHPSIHRHMPASEWGWTDEQAAREKCVHDLSGEGWYPGMFRECKKCHEIFCLRWEPRVEGAE